MRLSRLCPAPPPPPPPPPPDPAGRPPASSQQIVLACAPLLSTVSGHFGLHDVLVIFPSPYPAPTFPADLFCEFPFLGLVLLWLHIPGRAPSLVLESIPHLVGSRKLSSKPPSHPPPVLELVPPFSELYLLPTSSFLRTTCLVSRHTSFFRSNSSYVSYAYPFSVCFGLVVFLDELMADSQFDGDGIALGPLSHH